MGLSAGPLRGPTGRRLLVRLRCYSRLAAPPGQVAPRPAEPGRAVEAAGGDRQVDLAGCLFAHLGVLVRSPQVRDMGKARRCAAAPARGPKAPPAAKTCVDSRRSLGACWHQRRRESQVMAAAGGGGCRSQARWQGIWRLPPAAGCDTSSPNAPASAAKKMEMAYAVAAANGDDDVVMSSDGAKAAVTVMARRHSRIIHVLCLA